MTLDTAALTSLKVLYVERHRSYIACMFPQ